MFSILSFLAGAVAFGVLLRQRKRLQERKKVHPAALGTAGVVFVGAFTVFIAGMAAPEERITAEDRERLFAAHGYAAGKKIAEQYREGEVVVLMPDSEMDTSRGLKLLDAVKSALGKESGVVPVPVTPALSFKYSPEDCPTFSDLVRAGDYNKMLEQYRNAAYVIFAAGLPRDAAAMKLWRLSKRPAVFVLNGSRKLDPVLKSRLIAGYTTLKEKGDFDNLRIPRSYEGAFNTRFTLVTTED